MKRILKIVAVLVVLLVIVAVALPFVIDPNQFRPLLQSKLSDALGRQVTLGNLQLSILSGSVSANDLSIGDDPAFSKTPFVRAKSLGIGIQLMPLILSHKLNVTGITIQSPEIDLIQTPAGMWNFSSLGAKTGAPATPAPAAEPGKTPELSVDLVKITDGRLTLAKAGAKTKPLVLDQVNIQVTGFSATSSFPFSLSGNLPGGATIKLDGKAGPFNAGDAVATPIEASLHVTHLDLVLSGLLDASYGVGGVLTIDGNAKAERAVASITGKLKGEQLKLAKGGVPAKSAAEIDLAMQHDLRKQTGKISRMDVHLGKDVATISGTYNVSGETPELNLKLNGHGLQITELAAFLPPLNVELPAGASIEGGTAQVEMTMAGPLNRLVENGSFDFENTKLANYDLGSKMKVIEALAGISNTPTTEIQTMRGDVKAGPEGIDSQNLVLVVPAIGALAGAGTVSPSHALNFKMRLAVRSTTPPAGAGIPFTIQGTSSDPVFRPDVKGMVSQELKGLSGQGKSAASGIISGFLSRKKQQ
jgi:AsmA protein